ncbi:MAG: hypothetical protein AVDCRST_MAG64-3432, partial [uncultured Phycisphaerae bacterium]
APRRVRRRRAPLHPHPQPADQGRRDHRHRRRQADPGRERAAPRTIPRQARRVRQAARRDPV